MSYRVFESSEDKFQTVHLIDESRNLEAVIVPQLGNNAIALKLRGQNFLWRPERTLSEILASRSLFGIPFLSPWANRLSRKEYEVGGKRYHLNFDLGNLRYDHYGQPLHGLLLFSPWSVKEVKASKAGAEIISAFRFSAHPAMMAQFPFAHSLEMRHLLRDGRLYVRLRISSECEEALPVSIGFHPYYTIPNSHRDNWQLQIAGQTHFELNANQTPTGATSSVDKRNIDLKIVELDDVYSSLVRNGENVAEFAIRSQQGSLVTGFGPGYKVGVIYAPRIADFVCIEPMVAITDALNMQYSDGGGITLPLIEPGGVWEEEFWAEPSLGNYNRLKS